MPEHSQFCGVQDSKSECIKMWHAARMGTDDEHFCTTICISALKYSTIKNLSK